MQTKCETCPEPTKQPIGYIDFKASGSCLYECSKTGCKYYGQGIDPRDAEMIREFLEDHKKRNRL